MYNQNQEQPLVIEKLKFLGSEKEKFEFQYALKMLVEMAKEQPEIGKILETLLMKDPPIIIANGSNDGLVVNPDPRKPLVYTYTGVAPSSQEPLKTPMPREPVHVSRNQPTERVQSVPSQEPQISSDEELEQVPVQEPQDRSSEQAPPQQESASQENVHKMMEVIVRAAQEKENHILTKGQPQRTPAPITH